MNTQALTETTQSLMRAVVSSGCIRNGNASDVELAVKVMREELKAFLDLTNPKYADERVLVMGATTGLVMASLATECIRRILAERVS